jgi:hypothetical protein
MTTLLKKACFAAALAVPFGLATLASAQQQSLALSYKLDVGSAPVAAAPVVSRCAGLNWVTSLGACGRDLLARISGSATHDGPRGADGPAAFEAAVPNAAAPMFEMPNEKLLRSAGGKDSLIANSRPVEMLLRLGSKYRVRGADEGWEYYRFTDIAQEMRRHSSAHKAVALELLVPFQ